MEIFEWIEEQLNPKTCNSAEFIYDDMDSQSGRCLPIIYEPFDGGKKSHWCDRGALFDYYSSTGGKKLLDFGPGDGWPSLIVAPFVEKVVGIDGSARRIEVCTENAKRLGISNTEFIHVTPGSALPFDDNSFDGVMAASSLEQTPDPQATLRELYRVLKPGGRLRIFYEALGRYRNGGERDAWLWQIDDETCRLMLYKRHIDQEAAGMYGVTLGMSRKDVVKAISKEKDSLTFEMITVPAMERIRPAVRDARVCSLTHPSCKTLMSWLYKIGFSRVIPSHSGSWFAGELFDLLPEERRPEDVEDVDAMLRPLVEIVVSMEAPINADPMLTTTK